MERKLNNYEVNEKLKLIENVLSVVHKFYCDVKHNKKNSVIPGTPRVMSWKNYRIVILQEVGRYVVVQIALPSAKRFWFNHLCPYIEENWVNFSEKWALNSYEINSPKVTELKQGA